MHLEVVGSRHFVAQKWMALVQVALEMRGTIRLRIGQMTARLTHAMAAKLEAVA